MDARGKEEGVLSAAAIDVSAAASVSYFALRRCSISLPLPLSQRAARTSYDHAAIMSGNSNLKSAVGMGERKRERREKGEQERGWGGEGG